MKQPYEIYDEETNRALRIMDRTLHGQKPQGISPELAKDYADALANRPVQPQRLSDEDAMKLVYGVLNQKGAYLDIIRAVEAHYGIGQ